ncbi:SMI1/KNR4 family protein [Streptomyces spiramenti]|uniref:SMI1/KNR4 family protein n=1 Tax=Streptomyces spiramenti TaxID=2720606 RepID=A0ABX1AWA0_9ACTN|nr:SMI1/KNR4 family protein [Streptomyces spiramenti]NJP68532.1 SMI1/KNR4 family protein [Streptomyces spiramenti]
MSSTDDRRFPAALDAVAEIEFPFGEDGQIDFEPYSDFLPPDETTDWFRAWTGNAEVTGDAYLVFGQDGTGGHAAIWLVREGRPLTEQPVVFLGSEGELGVLAPDLAGFLWVLADGSGPYEAATDPERGSLPNPELVDLAQDFTSGDRRTAAEVIAAADAEFPTFEDDVLALCR